MKKENFKHICLIILSVIFIGIGYMNYDKDEVIEVASTDSTEENEEENIGDVQLVNSDAILENDNYNTVDNTIASVDSTIEEYFYSTKLERENMYSEMIETYQNMIDSSEINNDQKAIAIQEISNITNIKNEIMIAENLIKNKGFEDVVILVSSNNASIIVKSALLTQEQIAQIQNIVCRELNLDISNINISTKA